MNPEELKKSAASGLRRHELLGRIPHPYPCPLPPPAKGNADALGDERVPRFLEEVPPPLVENLGNGRPPGQRKATDRLGTDHGRHAIPAAPDRPRASSASLPTSTTTTKTKARNPAAPAEPDPTPNRPWQSLFCRILDEAQGPIVTVLP